MLVAPVAGAGHFPLLRLGWKHVVVHPDDHGNEYDRVVKKMQFHSRENQLQKAAWNRLAPEIVMECGLPDQQEMLDVMPELDRQGCRPPRPRSPGESFAEHPKPYQHD